MMQPTTGSLEVGAQLRSIREARGLSLADVERLSERTVKAAVLGAYERGERRVSVPRAAQIASAYGITLDVLLFGQPVTTRTCVWPEAVAS